MTNLKDTKSIWKHLRNANKKTTACDNSLPDELEINGQQYTNSQDIAFKLNDYFASISEYEGRPESFKTVFIKNKP